MNIGWIGLGHMGEPMAMQIAKAGYPLLAHNRHLKGRPQLTALGSALSSSIEDVSSQADFLGICLFDDTQLRHVLFECGALVAMKPGSILAVHTTGMPDIVEEISHQAPSSVSILDAPFSGTPDDAHAQNITLMVGGDKQALQCAEPILSTYCARIIHTGTTGTARKIKLLNNLLFTAQISLAHEILDAAKLMGLDVKMAAEVIQVSSGASYSMAKFSGEQSIETVMESIRPYIEKDVNLIRKYAENHNLHIPNTLNIAKVSAE